MTQGLLQLSDWLALAGCTHAAIESSGVYWRPVFNILEGDFEVLLVNAHHIKTVSGRKTDVRDREWICDLLRPGLLKASFIPPRPIRELRELTRHGQTLVRDLAAVANRIQKLIEAANIKLGQVATNTLGLSGRLRLSALTEGETEPEKIALLAKGKLKAKNAQLKQALIGSLTPIQRFLLKELLLQYDQFQEAIDRTTIGHCILVIVYHVLSKRASYRELGSNYFDRQNITAYRSKLVRKLDALGLKVTLEPAPT